MDAVNRNIHASSEFYPEERCVQNLQETGGNPGKKSGTGLERCSISGQITSGFRMKKEEICFRMRNSWHENQQNFEEIRR